MAARLSLAQRIWRAAILEPRRRDVAIPLSAMLRHVQRASRFVGQSRWWRDGLGGCAVSTNNPLIAGGETSPGPLAGLRVLDLSRVLAGPYCTMLLANLGADVVKVERPGEGDDTRAWGPPFAGGESAYYLSVNNSKRGITLDLATERDRGLARALALRCDVLVENFRPGTMEGWGLGYEELSATHSGLIYCAISGFSRQGPHRDRPGYDFLAQAMGGLMSITGQAEGEPTKAGVAVVDVTAGLYAGMGSWPRCTPVRRAGAASAWM